MKWLDEVTDFLQPFFWVWFQGAAVWMVLLISVVLHKRARGGIIAFVRRRGMKGVGEIILMCLGFFAIATTVTLCMAIVQPYTDEALTTLANNEWAMLPAVAISLAAFRLRGSRPFLYGMIEVIVGIVITWSAIHSDTPSLFVKLFAFLGGMYIVVRGLDNMDKGLPTWLRLQWDKLFPKIEPRKGPYVKQIRVF